MRREALRRVQATNTFGEAVGRLDLQWSMITDDFLARQIARPVRSSSILPFPNGLLCNK